MNETSEAPRTGDEAPSDDRKNDTRSSLDRLAEFARRILKVPKSEVSDDDGQPAERRRPRTAS